MFSAADLEIKNVPNLCLYDIGWENFYSKTKSCMFVYN